MKKGKLLLSIMGMCMALAVLCFGVYASFVIHNYDLGGNISYKVTDAYVQITTTTYKFSTSRIDLASTLRTCAQGLETKTLTELNSNVTVAGKTLTRIGRVGEVYDTLEDPYSEYSTQDDLEVTFSTEEGSEVYAYFYVLNVKNLSSSAPVYVKVTDNSQTLWDNYFCNMYHYRTQDIVGLTSSDTTSNNIVIGFALIDVTSEFEDIDFGYDVEVGIAERYNPLKIDAIREYYYVEMGDWYGVPVRWRLVGVNNSANFDSGESSFVEFDDFDEDDLPSDLNGVFIQETCVGQLINSSGDCTYYEGSITRKCNSTTVRFGDNNNYFSSTLRQYINGQDVQKRGSSGDPEFTSNFLTDLNIATTNYVYSHIQGRKLSDMSTVCGGFSAAPSAPVYKWTPNANTVTIPDGINASTIDKLWVVSQEELMLFLAQQSDPTVPRPEELYSKLRWGLFDAGETTFGSWWWTRTPRSSVGNNGGVDGVGDTGRQYNNNSTAVFMNARPCFQLAL